MKLWILTVLIGAAVAAPSVEIHCKDNSGKCGPRSIGSLLEDILEETGIKALLPWLQEKIQTDPDVQNFIDYLTSGKFDEILADFRACPGYSEVEEKLAAEGLDLIKIIDDIRNFVAGKSYYNIQPTKRALADLIGELIARLDLNRVITVIKDKIDNDPDMKKLIDFFKSDTFQNLGTCMKNSKAVKELTDKLYEEGIDLESLIEMIKMLFGNGLYYRPESRTVGELLESLIQELGLRDLLPWIKELIETDPDIQRVIEYLKSPAFKRIEDHLKSCPGYQETKDKLKAEGVDLVEILERIRNFITGSSYHARYYKIQPRRTLGEILDMIIEKLDLDKMIAIIHEKFHDNADLKKVIAFLKSDVFKGIVDCMRQSKDVQDLAQKLKDEGIDVQGIIELIESVLDKHYYYQDSRNIGDFLNKLVEELGLRELLPWIKEMIETDPDVQRIIEYLKSPAFKRIEEHLKACPSYQTVKDKLKSEGVDLVEILDDIRNFITGGSYQSRTVHYKIQPRRTLAELLEAILQKLDINRMIDIIQEKFHGDPDLQKVINFLKGQELKDIGSCMAKSPDVQDLLQRLRDEGIDFESLIEMVKTLLANHVVYSRNSRSIGSLLEDLIEELEIREMIPWVKEMIETDPDVQRIIDYLRGPVFLRIEDHLRGCPGYPSLRDKLKEEGVDLVQILQDIRNFFTGGDYFYKIQPRRTLGEVLSEVLARIDLNRVLEVIRKKIRTDPDMKKVVAFFKGPDYQGLVDCMKESKDVQALVQKLLDEDVDIVELANIIKQMFEGEV